MRAAVVRVYSRWKLEASTMSEYVELIDVSAMMGRLVRNGQVISRYKMENCDKCLKIMPLDNQGYVKSDPSNNFIWFCKECR